MYPHSLNEMFQHKKHSSLLLQISCILTGIIFCIIVNQWHFQLDRKHFISLELWKKSEVMLCLWKCQQVWFLSGKEFWSVVTLECVHLCLFVSTQNQTFLLMWENNLCSPANPISTEPSRGRYKQSRGNKILVAPT